MTCGPWRADLDRDEVIARLRSSADKLRGEPKLKANAEKNWYIVYGDPLPAGNP
jgi:hypothetical protein